MKTLSIYLTVLGQFALGKFLGDLFHTVIPILDWQALFMFWAGYLAYNLTDTKDI